MCRGLVRSCGVCHAAGGGPASVAVASTCGAALLPYQDATGVLHDCKEASSSLGLTVAAATRCAWGLCFPEASRSWNAVSHSFLSLRTGVKVNFQIFTHVSTLSLVVTMIFGKPCHWYQFPNLAHTLYIWANSAS